MSGYDDGGAGTDVGDAEPASCDDGQDLTWYQTGDKMTRRLKEVSHCIVSYYLFKSLLFTVLLGD